MVTASVNMITYERLEKEALTPMSAEELRDIIPSTDFKVIDLQLREVREFKLALENNDRFPLAAFPDIRPALKMLDIEGYTLQAESFQGILRILFSMRVSSSSLTGSLKSIS